MASPLLAVLLVALLWISPSCIAPVDATIRVIVEVDTIPRIERDVLLYRVVNERNEVLFDGGDLAVFTGGDWCVVPSDTHSRPQYYHRLRYHQQTLIYGSTPGLGKYEETRIDWFCEDRKNTRGANSNANANIPIVTSFRNYESQLAVVFDIVFPKELKNTSLPSFYGQESDRSTGTLATFPSFVMPEPGTSDASNARSGDARNHLHSPPTLPSALSWEGSFVRSVRRLSVGPLGGPTVFYNASDPALTSVIVASPFVPPSSSQKNTDDGDPPPPQLRHRFNQFTAGNHKDWTGTVSSFSPGLNGRLKDIPAGLAHSILLYQGSGGGITATMNEWGGILQAAVSPDASADTDDDDDDDDDDSTVIPSAEGSPRLASGESSYRVPKLRDVTLEKIGYQTDNGAMYCFCSQSNCSDVLLREKDYLDSIGIPIGYLSFQGAGTSSGRGKAAPWCVERWSADGGQDPGTYPLDTRDFQRALGVPLQLYAPYFCPNATEYFEPHTPWKSVSSNPSLPGCEGFAFDTVAAEDSKDFFTWFLAKGTEHAGMVSFESDFLDHNANCVEDFVGDAWGADAFLGGMADAALGLRTPIQWCYASPNVVMASLDFPAVTNFRVSFDFCYGRSYDIGESSLLVWALGAAPSKDTLWTTDNNRTETPGCEWTVDHEAVAAELHVVLAIMTTGPVGISDAIGMTNATLLRRIISKDGSLLQPSKPITAVDSSFLVQDSKPEGYLYETYGLGPSWIFVSFQLRKQFPVTLRDFWPPVETEASLSSTRLVYRTFASSPDCRDGADALESGCVAMISLIKTENDAEPNSRPDQSSIVFFAPKSSFEFPGSDLSPDVVTVWQECPESGVFFLGELDKYVALSPKRFQSVTCTEQGVTATLQGSGGEVIEITLLVPHPTQRYRVVKEEIKIDNHATRAQFDFPTNHSIQKSTATVAL